MTKPSVKKTKTKDESIATKPVETVSEAALCSGCAHANGMHYGSPEKWCNTSGCECLQLK